MRSEPDPKKAKPAHLTTAGPFGESVGASLKELLPGLEIDRYAESKSFDSPQWPSSRLHLVAAWRPLPRLMDALNAFCYASRTPLIPAIVEGCHLIIGPVVIPGVSACHACYERRTLQHSARPELRAALHRHYDLHPESGPQGHLNVFADLAAVRLAQLAYRLATGPDEIAGRVWKFDLLTRQSVSGTVTGMHGCPHCGMERDERSRSYSLLQAELAYLFEENAQGESAGGVTENSFCFSPGR